MNIFEIPANDQSVFYLGRIFGYVGAMLPITGPSALLGTLFKTFNTIALTVGVLVVVYTTVVGLLATAHEGEFLGKKWSGLWVPIRTLLGVAALFPTATGYSALQVIMMWVILQGVGAADTLWNTALTYVQVVGTPFGSINSPDLDPTKVGNTMKSLFQGLTCQATSRNSANTFSFCNANPKSEFCSRSLNDILDVTGVQSRAIPNTINRKYEMGPNTPGLCGALTFGNADAVKPSGTAEPQAMIKYAAYQAQQQALQAVVSTLGSIANTFSSLDQAYLVFYYNTGYKPDSWIKAYCSAQNISNEQCCVDTGALLGFATTKCLTQKNWEEPNFRRQDGSVDLSNAGAGLVRNIMWTYGFANLAGTDFAQASANYYISSVNAAIVAASQQYASGIVDKWAQDAKSTGWIFAGAFYYKMAQLSDTRNNDAVPIIAFGGVENNNPGPPLSNYRNNFQSAEILLKASQPPLISSFSGVAAELNNSLRGPAEGLMNNWMGNLTASAGSAVTTNPIAQVQSFGTALITTAEVIFSVFSATAIVLAGVMNISVFALGSGVTPGWGAAAMMAAFIFMPIIFALILALFTLGGLLAVYVPLIPFIIFTMAAIGWIIATIETMIAAPLVSLGMLSPGGQHEIFGRAEPAIMLLLNVFLRPSLMIFGMMAAMLFASVSVSLVNATFKAAMGYIIYDGGGGRSAGLTIMILFMAAYTFLIISVLSKCFSLIHLIPERVITWIGGHSVSYGEGEALGEVKRGTEAAAGATAGAGRGVVGSAQTVAGKMQDKPAPANTKLSGGGNKQSPGT